MDSTRLTREGKTIEGDSPSELYQEITPIVVNGVMYLPSGDRVVALEPETGKEIWTYEVRAGWLLSAASLTGPGTKTILPASSSPPREK